MIDILYVAWNRLTYTQETFAALLANTDWDLVSGLYVVDDGSTDGTLDFLRDAVAEADCVEAVLSTERLGGPVAATNWYLDQPTEMKVFAKIDNDMVVCPGWLDEMSRVLDANPALDILGMEPMLGCPTLPPYEKRTVTLARHIGGKGLIRRRAFVNGGRPVPRGYFGFTEWQTQHEQIPKGWITPDLPVFGLDQLPIEPWISLAVEYVEKGWQRYWPPYGSDDAYWFWWTPVTT